MRGGGGGGSGSGGNTWQRPGFCLIRQNRPPVATRALPKSASSGSQMSFLTPWHFCSLPTYLDEKPTHALPAKSQNRPPEATKEMPSEVDFGASFCHRRSILAFRCHWRPILAEQWPPHTRHQRSILPNGNEFPENKGVFADIPPANKTDVPSRPFPPASCGNPVAPPAN